MHETAEDLAQLQRQLDESWASAGARLAAMFGPERRSRAEDVAAALKGVFMINLATVTARGEPLVAPVDGMFYRGRLWFSLAPDAARARHLHARPQTSATYVEGDPGACLIVHGTAQLMTESHPLFEGFDRFVRGLYGIAIDIKEMQQKDETEPEFTGYIEPRRIYAQDFPKASAR